MAQLRITEAIREMLLDGCPHLEFELMLGLLRVIPPEIAARRISAKTLGGRERTLEERIRMGINLRLRSALFNLTVAGQVTRETMNGKPGWRLLDEERVTFHRRLQEQLGDLREGIPPADGGDT